MPQISHIKYKDINEARRFDADFFKPEYLLLREKIKNMKNEKLISFLLNDKVITWHTPSKQNEKFYWWNIKFIKTDNLRENYINHNFNDYLSEQWNDELRASELKKWDIIVTIIWASEKVVWRVSIVREEDLPANINQNIGLIRVNQNKINPDLLNIYLNCKYWRGYLHSLSRQTEQVNLNCREVENVLVPIFSQVIQQEISKIVQTAYNKNQQSKQLYQEAEDLLLTELWLKNHTISHTLTFSTTKKAVDEAWRYDADYFQPKYDELIEKIENYKWGREQLVNLTTYINNWNQPPYSESWNIKFFSQKWIKDKWIDYSFLESTEEPMVESSFFDEEKNKPSLVSKWDILYYSVWANLWYCHTYLADEKIAVWSFINIIRTDTSKFDSVAMWVILNSMIWRMQADRDKSWVAQPYIYAKNLRKFKIPLINPQLQKEISDKIKESFKLRNESKELLEQAKKMVEDEIEKE